MQNKSTVYALHGFLGLPSDWNPFFEDHAVKKIDLLHDFPILPFWDWASKFNQQVMGENNQKNILLGYSLGGRLAMHALLLQPDLWAGAIIVSAHYGLEGENQKASRREHDEKWAIRFESEKWEPVIQDWNQQPVFRYDSKITFNRNEKDFCRQKLAESMRVWSLGNQDNLLGQIEKLDKPILWMAGAEDKDYAQRLFGIRLSHADSKKWIASHAGHRIPWLQPAAFQFQIAEFLNHHLRELCQH